MAITAVVAVIAGLLAATPLAAVLAPTAEAAPCDPPVVNPIACENTRPGNPASEWDVTGSGSDSIQGFATEISVDIGETVDFKIDTPSTGYRLDIYRMGYYDGDGARKVETVAPSASLPQNQPNCLTQAAVGLTDCGNWAVSASWDVPADAVSGIYFAKLVRTDASGSSHVFFVVRDDGSTSDLLFQTSDTTWQAYNEYGGQSTYSSPRAYKVSYNRPFVTRDGETDQDWVFNAEYPMVRFLESNGYDVSYTTGVDTDRRGELIRNHSTFLSVGHDEYWSGDQRANVEAARAAGVNLAFFSGNEVFWKTRWEQSVDGSGTPYRTMVTYKETHDDDKIDPSPEWTGTWRDPRFSPPSDGGRPENALTGQIFTVNCCTTDMTVDGRYADLRFWRNTRVAALGASQQTQLGDGVLGYEWDEDLDNGHRPAGSVQMSETTRSGVDKLQDFGSSYGSGEATHHLTMYRHESGALVFGAGSVQWAWGLDDEHDNGGSSTSDVAVQQATVNLLADMDAQPATLQSGLVAASASTDTTAPTSTITAPASGSSVPVGQPVTVTGTAADTGGVVGAVEVSIDGGTTWRRAAGTSSWSYSFTPQAAGTLTVRSRAADDSARLEAPSAGVSVTVGDGGGEPVECPCTIWPSTATPQLEAENDDDPIELGVRFRASTDGFVSGVRFYKGPGNGGTHLGRLWSNTGTQLAQATFTGETASGWQQVNFASPVAVTAGTTYVASYYAPQGNYAQNANYFGSATSRGPLTALADGAAGGNGVYRYGAGGGFPTSSWSSANYWVDVVFTESGDPGDPGDPDTTPPQVVEQVPAANATGVDVTTTVRARFDEAVTGAQLTLSSPAGPVTGGQAYDAVTRTMTFTPAAQLPAGTVHTATLSGATDAAGNPAPTRTWTFTTATPQATDCPCTIWPAAATPQVVADSDTDPLEVGVRFRASTDGFIDGVRFYKGAGNGGTHLGRLWSNTGTQLAQATFTGESASGWQQVLFATPVAVTAGTTYVASYYAPQGRYSKNQNYFATAATTRGPLTALADGTDGSNGVYRYGAGGGFPTSTWSSTNYWVDVVFTEGGDSGDPGDPDTTPPRVLTRTPAAGAVGVDQAITLRATFDEPVTAAGLSLTLTGPGGAVAGTQAYDAATPAVTFDPSAALAPSTTYTATLRGVRDAAGNATADSTWTFTTASPAGCPCMVWPTTATPSVSAENDSSAVELGLKFRASSDGFVTGIRFFKGSGNSGTHTGTLWSAGGQALGTVTFTGETATGWQEATLGAPVAVTAGTTYVVSYHAPNGRYAVDNGYFADGATTRGPLTALADGTDGANGVYRYGASGFPTATYDSSNYWVDVVFDTDAVDDTAPTVTGRVPGAGQSGVDVSTTVKATFSEPVQSVAMTLTGPGGAVSASSSYDAASRTQTLTPQAPLAYSTSYTVNVSGARDSAGNTMAPTSWAFTTGSEPTAPPPDGPGGPIAVVVSGANPYSSYLTEILYAEGLNEFRTVPVSTLSAATLAEFDVVVLGNVAVTTAQAGVLQTWVSGGGNLVAMRPSATLSGLLGLTPASGTLAEGYLRVNTATQPGAGITGETIQFHGTADRYTLSGATAVATLYSTASAATTNPAVTLRSVGSNGGQAAAFTFDLARSVVQTRQGNPAWAGQERDGDSDGVIRTDDMFVPSGSQPGWVDMAKVAIPQADEQQRLLANVITHMSRDAMPVPRFWYFPGDEDAAVVATGDDHGSGGTAGRFDIYQGSSPAGCSVADWECLRITSYVYPGSPLTDSAASTYRGRGFEIGVHPENGCQNFTTASLTDTYAQRLAQWRASYPSLPSPVSNRFHCLVWSDWGSQYQVESANGIRLDTNYYYWPGSWVADRPGFMTGSGMPMRFANTDGTTVDVFQAATQMTDESGQSYPYTPRTLLERATGPLGYHGFFTANVHTDRGSTIEDELLVQAARDAGVPVITAAQLLTWLDGRNASSFDDLAWSGDRLTFGITVGTGASRLTAMLPTSGPGGRVLSTLTRGGAAVSLRTETVKGVEYAHFPAAAGNYVATYTVAQAAPAIAATAPDVAADGEVTIDWRTDEPAGSEVLLGTEPGRLSGTGRAGGPATEHTVSLDDLEPATTYHYRIAATDAAGRRSVWPPVSRPPLTVRTPGEDRRAPAVRDVTALALPDGSVQVEWRTDEPAESRVRMGTADDPSRHDVTDDELVTDHLVIVTGAAAETAYTVRVTSRDAAGNTSARVPDHRLTTPPAGVADHSAAAFRAGALDGGAVVTDQGLGTLTMRAGRARAGTFESRVLDAQAMVDWGEATWRADVPRRAGIEVAVRVGSTPEPDDTWSDWQKLSSSGDDVGETGRYLQYRVELSAPGAARRPVLEAIGFEHGMDVPTEVGETEGEDTW